MPSKSADLFREFRLTLDKDPALDLVRLLDDDSPLPAMIGYYEVLYEEDRDDFYADKTALLLYFNAEEPLAEIQIELLLAARGIEEYLLEERVIDRDSYLLAYKEHYQPFAVSPRIAIVPSWERGSGAEAEFAAEGLRPLYLDPGLAFGTGQHPTTRLCISFLDRAFDSGLLSFGAVVVDAGTGSGILAIAALLFGAERVHAFDVDNNALIASRGNAELNELSLDRLDLHVGGFAEMPLAEWRADLMLANITAGILLGAESLVRDAATDRLLLSGVIVERRDEVLDSYLRFWELLEEEELDGWLLFHLRRRVD